MYTVPDWLTEESITRTEALGREMAAFLRRQHEQAGDADVRVQPHQEFLQLLDRPSVGSAKSGR